MPGYKNESLYTCIDCHIFNEFFLTTDISSTISTLLNSRIFILDFFIQTYLRFEFFPLSLCCFFPAEYKAFLPLAPTHTLSLPLTCSRFHQQTPSFSRLLVSISWQSHTRTLTPTHTHRVHTHTHSSSIDNSARSFSGMAGLHISLNRTLHISESWLHTLQTFSPRPQIYLFLVLLNRRMFQIFLLHSQIFPT